MKKIQYFLLVLSNIIEEIYSLEVDPVKVYTRIDEYINQVYVHVKMRFFPENEEEFRDALINEGRPKIPK